MHHRSAGIVKKWKSPSVRDFLLFFESSSRDLRVDPNAEYLERDIPSRAGNMTGHSFTFVEIVLFSGYIVMILRLREENASIHTPFTEVRYLR